MPPAIDMGAIREALQRRQMGNLGGGGTPMGQQVSAPNNALPSGAPAAPLQPPAPSPIGQPQNIQPPAQGSVQAGALQAGQKSQGPQFDEETRLLAKSLIQRLLKGV